MNIFSVVFVLFLTSQIVFSQDIKPAQFKSENATFKFEPLLEKQGVVWGFDFLPDQRILFTERSGALKIFNPRDKSVVIVKGSPEVWSKGQGGLLDVRVHPKISDRIYLTYSDPYKKEASTAVAMATLKDGVLINFKKIFSGNNKNDEGIHFGSRIEFDDKGFIYICIGERNNRDNSQNLNFHNGKVIRLKDDGSVPQDNPFIKNKEAKPEIWSYGHRNPQGLVRDPETDQMWLAEMGPRGGDELNLIKPGLNYGWPVITYGREYYGPKIGEGTEKKGVEQPVAYWVPSISPSGITIYTGKAFPDWKGNIFIGTLSGSHLRRIVISKNQVVKQEELLKDLNQRIRNVRTGPDGFLYFSTDSGLIARLVPAQ